MQGLPGQVVARWSSTEDTVTSTGDLLGGKYPVLRAAGFYPQRPLKRNTATQAGHVKVKGSRNDLVSDLGVSSVDTTFTHICGVFPEPRNGFPTWLPTRA